MAYDDLPTMVTSPARRPFSRKHRAPIRSQLAERSVTANVHSDGFIKSSTGALSKLPNLLSKSIIIPSTAEAGHSRRSRSQRRDVQAAASYKFERQSTTMNFQTRLPTLCAPPIESDQRHKSESQRRQIYALNHLMRELEQEQFRQFCQRNSIGKESTDEALALDEESTQQLST